LSGISPPGVRATIWRVLLSAHGISGVALATRVRAQRSQLIITFAMPLRAEMSEALSSVIFSVFGE
jgi:hypothetical protein